MFPVTSSLSTTADGTSAGLDSTVFDTQSDGDSLLLLAADERSAGVDEALGEHDADEDDDAWADAPPAALGDAALALAWDAWDEL
jgi:hypothetical protein